jgi:hypothetical protein
MPALDASSTLFFLCDIQTKFSKLLQRSSAPSPERGATAEPAIYGYEHVVATANKMLKLAKVSARLFVLFICNQASC